MAISIDSLGINQLSVGERLQLIDAIWDSLPAHVDPNDIPAWHLAELANRRTEAEAHSNIGQNWRQVLNQIEAKLSIFR
jgi:putative addiction module component (TIGR02574 family)